MPHINDVPAAKKIKLDTIDSKIICLLQKDGRMPNTEIAKQVGTTEATVRNRLQRLTQSKVIKIVAIGDPHLLGFEIVGNIKIDLQLDKVESVVEQLKKFDEIWYIALLSGDSDLDVEFRVKSFQHLKDLLYGRINKIDGVVRTHTSFLLELIKDSYEWGTALEYEED